ncbi:MAG: hypothetical protein ACM33T_11845 [Solirubrobacterales bacterium]
MKGTVAVLAALALSVPALSAPAVAADGVPARLDAARAAYGRGDVARTVHELEGALVELQARLGKSLAECLPPALGGWQADPAEIEGLESSGGGLAVTRAYSRNDATMNAVLNLDSPAVEAAVALLANPAATAAQVNLRRVKVGAEDALMRWDSATKTGEITMVLGNRVLLEIRGDNLQSGDVLLDAAKGWNLAAIRKTAGI